MRPLKNNWTAGIAFIQWASQPVLRYFYVDRRKADYRLAQPAMERSARIGFVLVLHPRQLFCIQLPATTSTKDG
jgi:hypothetical protein